MPSNRRGLPVNPGEKREQKEFSAWVRGGNAPIDSSRFAEGEPAFPSPTVEEVLGMPANNDAEREAKRAAAETWLRQFCARARWHFQKVDLRFEARNEIKCQEQIDRVRTLLGNALIDEILERP